MVWRGSDFGYLPGLVEPKYSSPIRIGSMKKELDDIDQQREDKGQAAVDVLRKKFSTLLPRWKGVVLAMVRRIVVCFTFAKVLVHYHI